MIEMAYGDPTTDAPPPSERYNMRNRPARTNPPRPPPPPPGENQDGYYERLRLWVGECYPNSEQDYKKLMVMWHEDTTRKPPCPPVQPTFATVSHQHLSRIMAIVLIVGYVFSISGILMTHGSILSWAFFISVLAVNYKVYTPVADPPRYGTDAPPPPDLEEDMKKGKSQSDLMARLLDQALVKNCSHYRIAHMMLAVEVWNDFGWVVDVRENGWILTKKKIIINDGCSISVDDYRVWTRYNAKIYVPGVWVQYVLSDLKQIAEEVTVRIDHALRLEKIKRYMAVREKRERARLLEAAVNDTALFAGWDSQDDDNIFDLEGV